MLKNYLKCKLLTQTLVMFVHWLVMVVHFVKIAFHIPNYIFLHCLNSLCCFLCYIYVNFIVSLISSLRVSAHFFLLLSFFLFFEVSFSDRWYFLEHLGLHTNFLVPNYHLPQVKKKMPVVQILTKGIPWFVYNIEELVWLLEIPCQTEESN